jgi:hypothetical protein
MGTRREKTGIGRKERKEGAEYDMRRQRQLNMWNGCGEMREEGKELGEILNDDGREIGWMKKIWNRRDRMKKKGVGDTKQNDFGFFLEYDGDD